MRGVQQIARHIKPSNLIRISHSIPSCRALHSSISRTNVNSSESTASQPSPPSVDPSQPTTSSRIIDVMLGLAFGVTLYQGAQWLLEWPEPMSTIQNLINDDPLVRAEIGDPPRVSWFWTGTIIPQSNFSVAIPVSGNKGKGTVYARGVYDSKSKSWKLIYFQCSIAPLLQKHSLTIPQSMEVGIEPSNDKLVQPRSPLVMPANFDPTLLNKDQYVKYQEFLFKHGLKEWKPDTNSTPDATSTNTESSTSPLTNTTDADQSQSQS